MALRGSKCTTHHLAQVEVLSLFLKERISARNIRACSGLLPVERRYSSSHLSVMAPRASKMFVKVRDFSYIVAIKKWFKKTLAGLRWWGMPFTPS